MMCIVTRLDDVEVLKYFREDMIPILIREI